MLGPTGICVGDQDVTGLKDCCCGVNSIDIRIGDAADLKLKLCISFVAVLGDTLGHPLRRVLRDRAVKSKIIAVSTAKQRRYRLSARFAQNIPAGDIDCGFDIRMAA